MQLETPQSGQFMLQVLDEIKDRRAKSATLKESCDHGSGGETVYIDECHLL